MDGMNRKLLPMPPVHRCAESIWTERELRAEYRRELERERTAAARGIAWGVLFGAILWGCIGAIVWAVRIMSRFQ